MAIPYPGGPNCSYRDYDSQVYYWNLYQSGQGNVAAYPGTSNHGWGKAVDVATTNGVSTVKAIGGKYGWKWGEAPHEWWHVTYYGGYTATTPAPSTKTRRHPAQARRQRQRRTDHARPAQTARLPPAQGRVLRETLRPADRAGRQALPEEQRPRSVDGVVGDKTYDRIKGQLHDVDRNRLTDNEDHWVDLYYRHHKEADRKRLLEQMETIEKAAEPNDWDVHDRKIRHATLAQIANKHDKIHVD